MDYANPILDVVLRVFNCCANRASLVLDLRENAASLRNALDELKELKEDTERRIQFYEKHEQQDFATKKQVEGWLKRVEVVEQEASRALQSGETESRSKCFSGRCPKNCYSSSKVAEKVVKMVGRVKEEIEKGSSFSVVADEVEPICVVVDEKPIEKTVGLESVFGEAWASLEDEKVGILGLYGMGGVGKTTLLTKMNNEFLKRSHRYELVVWIVVSRQARVEQVQDAIFHRVGIIDPRWPHKGEDEKAVAIYKFFKRKRFVLLLDDIWKPLDLLRVGIPRPDNENECKVVFTTRSQEVCSQMEANKRIKVTCLGEPEALALFEQKVGEETLRSHPEIQSLAEIVARECAGLPLALIIIGRAMSSKKDPQEWRRAIEVLKSYPSMISGMGDHVFPILKFSYDSLRDETVKSCFLYCALFPEDYNITTTSLIELWIGEGFIEESAYDIHEAHNIGSDIVESLKVACLLEVGIEPNTVKMHDVIRDMALWLSSTNKTNPHQIVVEDRAKSIDYLKLAKWNRAERVTLWKATSISGSSPFANLFTLFIRDCKTIKLPPRFFHHMPTIRVLDLSNTCLTVLPDEIRNLASLRYLNLSSTSLSRLPRSLGHLKELRYLLLNNMGELKLIPPRLIRKLSHLRALSILHPVSSDAHLDRFVMGNVLSSGKEALLSELGHLERLDDLCINLSQVRCLEKLQRSEKLSACIRWLRLARCRGLSEMSLSSSSVERLMNLETLEMKHCRQLNRIKVEDGCFRSLRSVTILDSPIVELTWLIYAPCLEVLQLQGCQLLEEVVSDAPEVEREDEVFARLKSIMLFDLPRLKSVSPRTLPFPSLELMNVTVCPNLRKLPFGSSTKTDVLKRIEGWPDWWQRLQWEDERIKLTFQAFFCAF